MATFKLSDYSFSERVEAANMAEALEIAESNWKDGSWHRKALILVKVSELDGEGEKTGAVDWGEVEVGEDPEAPECTEGEHEWQSPHQCVGGIDSNPGVWSSGGTTITSTTCCCKCGAYRVEVSYGSQRNPGQCDQVEYLEADAASLKWIGQKM